VSVENFHRSARARPPPADTPDEASAITTSQVTSLIQDFAVSLNHAYTALYWLACSQDTEAQDGLGLPGSHGCGAERVANGNEYLG
jgi:hypothetical protein